MTSPKDTFYDPTREAHEAHVKFRFTLKERGTVILFPDGMVDAVATISKT